MVFVNCFAKAFIFFSVILKQLLILEPLLAKIVDRGTSIWWAHVFTATSFWWVRPEGDSY